MAAHPTGVTGRPGHRVSSDAQLGTVSNRPVQCLRQKNRLPAGLPILLSGPLVPTTAKRTSRVLILTSHSLVAGLLGILIELESFEPVFAGFGETPEEALARIKPLSTIFMDGDLEAARSDLFFARAARRGVRVILFRSPVSRVDVQALAEARNIPWTPIPVDRQGLAALLIGDPSASRRRGDRRSGPSATTHPDGTLRFRDRQGRQWTVYDRRSGPRRAEDRSAETIAETDAYRAFVNEQGEEWRFPLTLDEPRGMTAAALERQLSRARRHTTDG